MFTATLKSLLGRKLRLVMSTFAIVLGVGFVAGTLVFTDTLSRSFTGLFASTVGDVVVRPVGGPGDDISPTAATVPADLVADLAAVEGAARADGNVTSFGVFVVGENGKVVGGQGAPGIGGNLHDAPAGHGLEGLHVVEGEEPDRAGEVALDRHTAEKAGYEIGDEVHLVTSGAAPVQRPTLVGIADFADGGSLNGATMTVFEEEQAQELFLDGKDVYTDAWVTAADGVSQTELRDAVAQVLPPNLEAVTGDRAADEAASDLMEAISFISTFLLVFAGISLVVGSFLIVNTFSILVAQRSRELALLRALGASRRQVTRSVLLEAGVLGLVGASVGLGVGVLLALGLQALFATFGLELAGQQLVFAPRTVVASYAVGMTVTVLAAYLPARRASRIAPVEALRDDVAMPESSLHRRALVGSVLTAAGATATLVGLFLDVSQPTWWVGLGILATLLGVAGAAPVLGKPVVAAVAVAYRRAFGTVGGLAGENALRNPRRTAATASALMIGLALVTTMAVLGSSAKASVDEAVEEQFVGDLVVSNVVGVPFSTAVGDEIARTPGVESVTRFRYGIGETSGHRQGLLGVDAGTLAQVVDLEMVAGSVDDLVDGTVLVSAGEAEDQGLAVGDSVAYDMPAGPQRYDVVGIFEDNPVLSYPYTTTLGTMADAGFQEADNYLLVTSEEGTSTSALQATIERQTAELPTVTVKDQAGFAEEQRGPIDQLLTLIYALLGLALVIAVLGIVNTLALSVIERTREIGLLRAVGLERRQLRRMVRLEAVAIALLGGILGVGMGLLFGLALVTSMRDDGLSAIVLPWTQIGAFVAAAGAVGVVAAALPARRAARLDILRAVAAD
ncbi:MAG TPA: FtsX-like permease family protein [Nocardioidaceae bacterium]